MRVRWWWVLGLVLLGSGRAAAINVYEVKVQSEADVLVYLVDQEALADVKVYNSKSASDGKSESGLIWYFTTFRAYAKLKVFYVQYPFQADLLVFYVDRDFKALWVNQAKKVQFGDRF